MNIIKTEKEKDFPKEYQKTQFIDFLHHHLGKYGDTKQDIKQAINYAFSNENGKGGFILLGLENKKLIAGVVINDTGMKGYIPDHFLVYITTHEDYRGKGIGTILMKKILEECQGDIALHVEYDNPALHLYKKVGFTNKYAEMRYKNRDA